MELTPGHIGICWETFYLIVGPMTLNIHIYIRSAPSPPSLFNNKQS